MNRILEERINKSIEKGSKYFCEETRKWWHSKIQYQTYWAGYFIETVRGWDEKRKHHILYINSDGIIKKENQEKWIDDLRNAKKYLKKAVEIDLQRYMREV